MIVLIYLYDCNYLSTIYELFLFLEFRLFGKTLA